MRVAPLASAASPVTPAGWDALKEAAIRCAVILGLFYFSEALFSRLLASAPGVEDSSILRTLWYPIYLATLIGLASRPWRALMGIKNTTLLWLCAGLAVASVFWSLDSGLTLRRGVALMMTTAFGVYIAVRFSWEDMIGLFAWTFVVLGVMSLLACLAAPGFGVHQTIHPGAWRGLWWEKNTLGGMMVHGGLAAACMIVYRPDRWGRWLATLGLSAALVAASTSKTSLLALLTALALMAAIGLGRRDPRLTVFLVLGALVFGSATAFGLVFAPEFVFGLIGREPTLTGRTDIWVSLWAQIQEAFWTGFGYGVFWEVEDGPVYWVRRSTQWAVPTAHNGWLETWLAIGVGGVAVFALAYLGALGRAVARLSRGPEVYWALPFLVIFLVFSVSESNILQRNNLNWVLFVATAAKLASPRKPSVYGLGEGA
ncbi:MAG: O-antigen ligase family protein [Maricaulaceae bacterium]